VKTGQVTRVYLSYRPEDGEHITEQLAQRLGEHFEVAVDGPAVEPESAVLHADVVVAVIGARWTDILGQRQSHRGTDRVSAEIALALRRGLLVIPVLVDGARMPTRSELPEALEELAGKRAVLVGTDSFTSDSSQLISSIERRVPAHQEPSSAENKDALRQRRIAELEDGIRASAEAEDWQTVLNLGSELTWLRPDNDDPDGLVTLARKRLAEARRRRLSSNPDLGIEAQGPRAVEDPNEKPQPRPSSVSTPGEESPPQPVKSVVVPLVVLLAAILVVVLILATM
jgi:hypothetical protein